MGTPLGRKAHLLMLVAVALVSTPGKRACPGSGGSSDVSGC